MQKRHSLGHLFWRGVVAAGGQVAFVSGVYPLGNQLGVALSRAVARKPQPPGLLRAVAGEWAMAQLIAAARPLGFFGLPVVRRAAGPRPVLLLHGYAMGRANFLLLANRLALAGLGPLVGFEYWTLGGVEKASRALAAFVEEVCVRLGCPQVDLVGHSMGGMVARHYATLGAGASRVRHLVTLGSPHGGTPLARFGIGKPSRELAADSELVRQMAAVPVPPEVDFTLIWSRTDGLVSGRHGALLDGAEVLEFHDLGHLALLGSRRVARELAVRLAR
jgi:pimeloyl-ACP methyl ester carboxylesterase